MKGLTAAATATIAAAAMVGACTDAGDPAAERDPAVDVRVMTFNIEWGGTHVSFDNVVEAIRRAEADIVGIQEAEGNLVRLADALGWHYDLQNYAISRFPLMEPPGADGKYVLVEVRPNEVLVLANLHLPSDPSGPDLVRDGATLAEVLDNERSARMPALTLWLEPLAPFVAAGLPVVVTGDFNAPAHSDWTEAMVGARRFLKFAVPWPVSLAMEKAGFRDAWRTVYPDAKAHPGLTWWAGRPPLADYAPGENDPQERIDQIWFAGPVEPRNAAIVGEPDGPEVAISVSPWPSDHRGVVATFAVRPAPAPTLVTTDRRVFRDGETPTIVTRLGDAASLDVAIRAKDGDSDLFSAKIDDAAAEISWTAPRPGHYVLSGDSDTATLEREFWVLEAGAEPAVSVSQREAEAIVSWQNAPGNRNDYVALYAEDTADLVAMLAWTYVDARPEGSLPLHAFGPAGGWWLYPGSWSPPPGAYRVRLMLDDGYTALAETPVFNIP